MTTGDRFVQKTITDDMDALLDILPPHIKRPLVQQADISELVEVVLDLGRVPEARFPKREVALAEREVDETDIDYVVARVGAFGDDNRAGIERTLHRISAIRNRRGGVVGLTCRVGRAVYGTIKIIEDLVDVRQERPAAGPAGRRQDDHAARGGPRPGRRRWQAGHHRRHLK